MFHCSAQILPLAFVSRLSCSEAYEGLRSLTRDHTCVPCIAVQSLNHRTTREGPNVIFFNFIMSKHWFVTDGVALDWSHLISRDFLLPHEGNTVGWSLQSCHFVILRP